MKNKTSHMCFKNKKDETGWLIERSVDPDRMGRRYIGVVCGHSICP
jgi:hypothetical protein